MEAESTSSRLAQRDKEIIRHICGEVISNFKISLMHPIDLIKVNF